LGATLTNGAGFACTAGGGFDATAGGGLDATVGGGLDATAGGGLDATAGAGFAGTAGAGFASTIGLGLGVAADPSPAIEIGALQLRQGTVPPRLRTILMMSSPSTNVVEQALQRTCMAMGPSLH
jgi:hypothetical protein